jgi:type I pantothenate kinase
MEPFPLSDALRRLVQAAPVGVPFIVGVGGGVAVGKSTFAAALSDAIRGWPGRPNVVAVNTDGFLLPNAELEARNIAMRKGFPESFDFAAMRSALMAVKAGARVAMPLYSHVTYDVDTTRQLVVERPDVLVLDGLHLAQVEVPDAPRLIDALVYLDAEDAAIEGWFTARLLPLMLAGRNDPASFYHRFRDWDDAQRAAFAKAVWDGINLPNLRDHIIRDRDAAHFVVRKAADHGVSGVEVRG